MQHRGEPDNRSCFQEGSGADDGSSVPEVWLTVAVREAVGEVPRWLLSEVANWPAPGRAGRIPH